MDEFKEKLSNFYNKFNENKRLDTRHGQVEFLTSLKYIHEYLEPGDKIVDIGAGPGRYSLYLKSEGYDVTAVEYVRPNIGMLRAKDKYIRIVEANAVDLSMFKDDEFDVGIMFGPMYHLYKKEDRLKALNEAKRICRKYLFVTYIMNEYAVIEYAFKDDNYRQIKDKLTADFHIDDPDNLFFQVRIEDIDELNKEAGLKLLKRFASDGPTDYMRSVINKMDDETFEAYLRFHQATCERKELLGASSHIVDVLEKQN
ncbi:MAG: methyltransferase domain-containing protein [Erysipelotrichaceae bacterium]|nr:methyltransferase domain-containing protein [Erysipelotrichaceae bacterium]